MAIIASFKNISSSYTTTINKLCERKWQITLLDNHFCWKAAHQTISTLQKPNEKEESESPFWKTFLKRPLTPRNAPESSGFLASHEQTSPQLRKMCKAGCSIASYWRITDPQTTWQTLTREPINGPRTGRVGKLNCFVTNSNRVQESRHGLRSNKLLGSRGHEAWIPATWNGTGPCSTVQRISNSEFVISRVRMADLLLTKASDDYFIHTSPKTKSVKSPLLHHQGTFEILVVSTTLHAKKKKKNISWRQEVTPHKVQSIDKLQINE